MKVVIHGATNLSNFGDMLFAKLFYDRCLKNGFVTDFYSGARYGIGDFCRQETGYKRKCNLIGLLKSDAMIMMSGGYLGEDKNTFHNTIKRYFRFLFPARVFLLTGKPLYILGVGGGPLFSKFLQKATVRILNKANILLVRDEETRDYFVSYGCKNKITVTTDTALNILDSDLPKLECSDEIKEVLRNNKIVLLHLVYGERNDGIILKKIIPALNRFLEEHPEYHVIASTDGDPDKDVRETKSYKNLPESRVHAYQYTNSMQMCSMINRADFVITMKLHVGILASSFGKSVISFPLHREKVGRFYKQIGEENRSINIAKCDSNIVYDRINKFYNLPIHISDNLREEAKKNLEVIDSI